MTRLRLVVMALALALGLGAPGRAATVVAVDPGFAKVASVLLRVFADRTGHELVLSVAPVPALEQTPAAVLLAPDAETPERLAEAGQAAADTLMTYATDLESIAPRGAVLMQSGLHDPVARAFLAFLLTPEAWDVIVAHGFGAH